MEIPASIFFGIWSNVGVLSLYLGFTALHNVDLPASVSPAVLFLFKHFLAVSASHSSMRTLVFNTKLRIHVLTYCALFSLIFAPIAFLSLTGVALAVSFKIYSLVNAFVLIFVFLPWKKRALDDEYFMYLSLGFIVVPLLLVLGRSNGSEDWFLMCVFVSIANFFVIHQPSYNAVDLEESCLQFHFMAMFHLLLTTQLSPVLVLLPSFLTCVAHAAISGDERFQRWLPWAVLEHNRILSGMKRVVEKNANVIEYSVGMGGTILFQYFFRLTTFDQVVAFLYFAVAWLANLAVLLSPGDFGVFNFFLSNVIVGCTVSQFGVGWTTWIAYAASLLLYVLRVKLELLCVVRREGKPAVVTWRRNQTTAEETEQIV